MAVKIRITTPVLKTLNTASTHVPARDLVTNLQQPSKHRKARCEGPICPLTLY